MLISVPEPPPFRCIIWFFTAQIKEKTGKNISFGVFSKSVLLFEDFIGRFWFLPL
jgi:hypothetical protein